MLAFSEADLIRIDEDGFFLGESKSAEVKLVDVVVKAVVLLGGDGVKLIDLYKGKFAEARFGGVAQAVFFTNLLAFFAIPIFKQVLRPLDKVFWGLAGG